ncbi:MAG: FG-GAP repeat domain-containing protein, partial [Flavobacteriales bacterium]
MKKIYLMLAAFTAVAALNAQTFTNSNNLLDDDYNSGGCLGVSDMDNDGFDDIILLDNSTDLKIIYQTVDGMSEVSYGTVSGANQWGMAVGDVDNDGHSDVFSGGNFDGTHLVKIANVGVSEQQELNNGQLFMQGCNLADIDNDGMLDAFGCHDVGLSKIWMNNGTTLVYDGEVIDLESYDFSFYPDTDHSGNYGSTWTDFDDDGDIDLFIAKCRQGVGDATDPRRINQLWVNDGNNNYTEQAVERGLVPYEQSWTSDFADIDNDGDFDCLLTNHSNTMLILENNAGYFTDITEGSGLA